MHRGGDGLSFQCSRDNLRVGHGGTGGSEEAERRSCQEVKP